MAEADVDDIVADGAACAQLEEAREGRRCHTHEHGEVFEADVLFVVGLDIFLDLVDAARFGRCYGGRAAV